MKKMLKKIVEAYAKNSTNACAYWWLHQPKAPRCLIKKQLIKKIIDEQENRSSYLEIATPIFISNTLLNR